MSDDGNSPAAVSLLTLPFLHWVAERPRTYAEVMGAWRTSCPRLAIWKDSNADGLVEFDGSAEERVILTPRRRAMLGQHGPGQ